MFKENIGRSIEEEEEAFNKLSRWGGGFAWTNERSRGFDIPCLISH